MSLIQIVGRRSSLFTRMPLIFAGELGVPFDFVPIYDMTELGPDVYAGNPALKLPILRANGSVLFGAQNICRALAERASKPARIVWPEALSDDLSRNAQELVWHWHGRPGSAHRRHDARQAPAGQRVLCQGARRP